MSRVCILTDSTAQFTRSSFPGHERVFMAPFTLRANEAQGESAFPSQSVHPRLVAPSEKDFLNKYRDLSRQYDSILVLTLSSLLSPATSHARSAAARFNDHTAIEVLDTRSTSVGLGWLVEEAAAAALAGERAGKIIDQIRVTMPRIYLLFFVSDPAVLVTAGRLAPAQALVAGMLGLHPVFLLEDGRLALLEKARSQRGVLEYFEEFLDEFDSPARVALVHGSDPSCSRLGALRHHIQGTHPQAQFVEQALSPDVEALMGMKCIGLAIKQKG